MKQTTNYPEKIMPVLKNLAIGDSVTYPLARVMTLRATIQMLRDSRSLKFETKKDKATQEVTVKRIA